MKFQVLNPANADGQGNARPLILATIPHPEKKEYPEGMQIKALDKEGTFELGAFEAHYLKEHGMIVNRLESDAKPGTPFDPIPFNQIGYASFGHGKKRKDCPYNPKTETQQKDAWIDGWDQAHDEKDEIHAAFTRGAADFKKHVKEDANPLAVADPENATDHQKALAASWVEGWQKAKDQA